MTFYNVISGVLFLAACQALLVSLGTPAAWVAAVLVVSILNDSVLTSELVERRKDPVDYTLAMKLLDFVTFAVFSWALLVLNPSKNAFDVEVAETLWGAGNPKVFWSILTTYWLLMLLWNQLAGQRKKALWKPWFFIWMHAMALLPLVALVFNWDTADLNHQVLWTVWLNLGVTSVYLVSKTRAAVA